MVNTLPKEKVPTANKISTSGMWSCTPLSGRERGTAKEEKAKAKAGRVRRVPFNGNCKHCYKLGDMKWQCPEVDQIMADRRAAGGHGKYGREVGAKVQEKGFQHLEVALHHLGPASLQRPPRHRPLSENGLLCRRHAVARR